MNLNDYQALALRTEKLLPSGQERLEHAALGLITEIGEIATQIKRIAIYEKSLDSLEKDGKTLRVHIAEEIGDVCWYLAIAADVLQLNLFTDNQVFNVNGASLKETALALGTGAGAFINIIMAPEPDSPKLADNISDLWLVMQALAFMIDTPIEQILDENIAKLRERFPDAYSNEAAEARADKGGLDARSS